MASTENTFGETADTSGLFPGQDFSGLITGFDNGLEGVVMSSVEKVESVGIDPKLVADRRGQVIRAAVKLFSANGYYNTTTQQIAHEAGMSAGLIYHYFQDKDDILFLALQQVLDNYEREIPAAVTEIEHPVSRLCTAIFAYCRVVNRLREATVLTYRSTKSLRPERRVFIKEGETRTNRLMETYVVACIDGDYMRSVNSHMLVYVMVSFAHTWALKYWALCERYTLRQYVEEGLKIFIEPHLTRKGLTEFEQFKIHLKTFVILPEHDDDAAQKYSKKLTSSASGRGRRGRFAAKQDLQAIAQNDNK